MQDLIKRYFWVLGARRRDGVRGVRRQGDRATSSRRSSSATPSTAPKVTPVAPTPVQPRQADAQQGRRHVRARATCSARTARRRSSVASTRTRRRSRSRRCRSSLLATNVGQAPRTRTRRSSTPRTRSRARYAVGDPIPGATGKLKAIHYKYVDFENNGHVERLVLAGATPPVAPPRSRPPSRPPDEDKDELQAAIDNGIKKIDDNNYEIDKSLVDKVLANPMAVAKGARVVPAVKNGKPDGFKLYAIRPSSVVREARPDQRRHAPVDQRLRADLGRYAYRYVKNGDRPYLQ